jgi:predicted component of type VI protein secretion system
MQAVLVMIRSDGERRSFSIARDMTVIGRREDCDLRIPLGEISRKHCRLVRDEETLRVEDLGSSNGTYHNGQRVQESVLAAGDTIQIGPVVFVLQLDGVPADEDLHPVASPDLQTTETDMQANVTEGEYAAEGAVAMHGQEADGVYASEGEYAVAEGEFPTVDQPASEEAYVAEEQPAGEGEAAEAVTEVEEVYLGEEGPLASEAHGHAQEGAGEAHEEANG